MNYKREDILEFLRSQYEFQLEFDPSVIRGQELRYETPIWEWIDICDLLPANELAKVYHAEFGILEPIDELETILNSTKSTIRDFCDYIAKYAPKQEIRPIKLLGTDCQTASIFKTLMSNLSQKGIDTKNVSPTSNVNPIFLMNAGVFISEINKITPGLISKYEYKENKIVRLAHLLILVGIIAPIVSSIIWKLNILMCLPIIIGVTIYRYGKTKEPDLLKIDEFVTFRDLVKGMNEYMLESNI